MADPIRVTASVVVPAEAISVRAVRSQGPGGQNVNKVASRIELRVRVAAILGLPEDARARLQALAGSRLTAEGELLVSSQKTRDQGRNLEDARAKVRELVARSLQRPRPRRPTRVPAGARAARLAAKKRDAGIKKQRSSRPSSDD